MLLRRSKLGLPAAPAFLVCCCALALSGCNSADNDQGPTGISAEEAQMLDEAAEMLDERQAELEADIENARIEQKGLPKKGD